MSAIAPPRPRWLRARDPGLSALRRAGRAAIVMPATFALGDELIGNPAVATFAAFGSFALLLLVDFGGPLRDRLQAQAALSAAGALLVCVGSLASRSTWVAVAAMTLVGFALLFAGVVSSVLASATVSLLLAFILSVSLAAPLSAIPDRLAGFGIASGAAFLTVWLLWPAPAADPLRAAAIAASRALAARMRVEAAFVPGAAEGPSPAEHDALVAGSDAAVEGLRRRFFATPYRPTGLSTGARAVVRLVDELHWLSAIVAAAPARRDGGASQASMCTVKEAAAAVLERGADLLERPAGGAAELDGALARLRAALDGVERSAVLALPVSPAASENEPASLLVSALDPGFRAQELSFAVSQIAANSAAAAAAERRSWLERLGGRQPPGLAGPLAAAQERAAAHVERHSVWLHNSVRGAIGLGLAVLVAKQFGVQHAFWVVLGTLSVLRSNALSTGQNIVRGLLGTLVGFVVGAGLLALVGTNTTLLWLLLPPAVLVAGFAPAAISFAAGQAAFTLTLVILFNIVQPAGWRVGLLRIEDVALGCAVSLVVGLLFWPRGAAAALGDALAEAYTGAARYLHAAVGFALGRCDRGQPGRPVPAPEAAAAAAAARRLDDAFRGFLAERGAKRVPLAEVTSLVNGVVGLRLAADAVLDLWQRDEGEPSGDRAAARQELLASLEELTRWYTEFAASLDGRGTPPPPQALDARALGRLVEGVRQDLHAGDARATAVAVRLIWTGDHLDAVRRLEGALSAPAHSLVEARAATRLLPTSRARAAHGAVAASVRAQPPPGLAENADEPSG